MTSFVSFIDVFPNSRQDLKKEVETINDANDLNITDPVAYVTQTTLSVEDTKDIIELLKTKFPNILYNTEFITIKF